MVGTLMEHVEMKRETKQLEEISDRRMEQLPKGLRLDFPIVSTQHWKRITPLLRQFAEKVDTELRRKELTPYEALENIWAWGHSLRREVDRIYNTRERRREKSHD